ncbi:hypothetical protein PPYR_02268 [Photinus pyralis]|uniref:DUF4806 domain-containing protein n=1 Tax=Photinus pyralis TaxID=7054 RepID=A0A5N4B6W3_PHOPY|nr:hypothetical protein PPYR_02268 [Photinus pyralis]
MVSNQAVFNLLRSINDQLVKCDLLLQSHTDKLNGIEKKLNILPFQQDIPVLSIELPLKTVEELEHFEETLKDETQLAALKHILKRLVESTERSSVFKMLSKMFDFELATICSWKGRKQNYRTENLALIKILIETVHDSFPYAKDGVIEHAGIDWFRAAQQRFARRKNTLQ